MHGSAMKSAGTLEFQVGMPDGRLFTKVWSPAPSDHGDHAPIILLHDSLGCVDLWRDWPGRLALATSRVVCANDRLGFGRSDPHPGTLGMDFIRDIGDEFRIGMCPLR